jgi:membrane fusion protein (multidrug efflux system)
MKPLPALTYGVASAPPPPTENERPRTMPLRIPVVLTVTLVALQLLIGCKPKPEAGGPAGGMPTMQVVAVEARRQPVTESLALVGSIAANELIEIKSEIDGTIQEILFREGQQVEQGQLLIRLDETKLAADVAEYESNFKLGQANFERAKQLAQEKLISVSEYDQAAATFDVRQATLNRKQRELKDTRITAPFSGVIGARNVSPGQVIARNTLLTWLVDVDPVKVELNVPERFLGQLQLGQTLDLTVAAFGTNQFHGKVYFIAPAVDPNTRTTLVKAEIPNPKLELKPGMFANLELNLQVRENAIVIPETALGQLVEGGGAVVFVVDGASKAQPRKVKLGVRLAGKVEVIEGIETGDRVIVEGLQKIGPGMPVQFAASEARPAAPSSK